MNAFALVALPTAFAAAGTAGFADDGVVRLGDYAPGKKTVASAAETADGGVIIRTQATVPPGVPAAPLLDADVGAVQLGTPPTLGPVAPAMPLPPDAQLMSPPAELPGGLPPTDLAAPIEPGMIPPAEMPPATVSPASPIVEAPFAGGPATPGPAYMPAPVEVAPFHPIAPMTPSAMVGAAPRSVAETIGAPGGAIGYALTPDPAAVLFNVGRRNFDILGVDEGFTSIGGYMPIKKTSETSHLFFNPRAIITDVGKGAVNLGLGHRVYNPATDRMSEASIWYDYDDGHAEEYQQFGFHFASIGDFWTYRAGGNVILGDDLNALGTLGASDPRIDGNNIVFTQTTLSEVAYNRFYGEVELPLNTWSAYGGTFAVGGYYLDATDEADESPGVSVRAESQITEDLWVNVLYTHDDIFDSNVSVNFNFTIPEARPSQWFRRRCPKDYLYGTTRRPYRVATHTFESQSDVTAINPKDGEAFTIAFIDPNADNRVAATDPLASGSVSDPYGSTADYMAVDAGTRAGFDAIVVRPNDPSLTETSIDALGNIVSVGRMPGDDLDTPLTLLDCQALVGEQALGGFLATTLGLTDVGDFAMASTTRPLLSNAAAPGTDVVTLIGGGHTVAGVSIDATGTADAIVGDSQTGGFTIFDNQFVNFQRAIAINHFGDGRGIVRDNSFDGNGAELLDAVGQEIVGFGATDGILITQNAGQLDLLIADNDLVGINGEDANANGVLDPTEDVNGNGVLDTGEDRNGNGVLDLAEDGNGNGILDVGRGITVAAVGVGAVINAGDPAMATAPGVVDIQDVGITGNNIGIPGQTGTGTLFGITVEARDGGLVELVETDNVVGGGVLAAAGLIDPGFVLTADNGMIDVINFEDNLAIGVGGLEDGGQFTALNGGMIRFDDRNAETSAFDGNVFSSNGGNGLIIVADDGLISFDSIIDNTFGESDLSGDGLVTPGMGGGTGTGDAGSLVATILSGTFSGGSIEGVATTGGMATTGSQAASTISGGTLSGGSIDAADGTLAVGQILNVTISGTDLELANAAVNLADATVTDTVFDGQIVVTEVPSLAEGVTLNDGTGNGLDGLVLLARNNGVIRIDEPLDQNSFVGNGGNGLTIRAESGGSFAGDFGFTGVDADNVALTGMNTFDDNLRAGLSFQAGTGATLTTAFENLSLTGNTGGGLELVADGGTLQVAAFNNLDLSDNGTFGANLVVNNGGTLILPGIANTDFSNNAQAGLLISGENPTGGPDGTLVLGTVVNNNFARNVELGPDGELPTDADGDPVLTPTAMVFNSTDASISTDQVFATDAARLAAIAQLQTNPAAFLAANDLAVSGTGFAGILFETEDVVTTGTLLENQFVASNVAPTLNFIAPDPNNAGMLSTTVVTVPTAQVGPGVGGNVDGGGANLAFGTAAAVDRNVFIGNGDGHIALVLEGDSENVITVEKHILTGATDTLSDLGSSLFNGEGIGLILRDEASLSGFVSSSQIADNDGDGVLISVDGNNLMGGPTMAGQFGTVNGFVIGGPGDPRIDPSLASNTITGNGDAGIRLVRRGNGQFNAVQILGNVVNANGLSPSGEEDLVGGLVVDTANLDTIDTIFASQNTFNFNAGAGATLIARGDAILDIDFDSNEFVGNVADSLANIQGGAGILISEQVLSEQDERGVGGNWTRNLITDNAEDGIAINGRVFNLSIGLVGMPELGNSILRNQSDGIELFAAGDVTIAGNLIAQNGLGGVASGNVGEALLDFDEGALSSQIAGIDIDAVATSEVGIFQNDITDNRGDGIEWVNDTDDAGSPFVLNVFDNTIDFNDGRGFDYLLSAIGQGRTGATFTDAQVVLNNNDISGNLLEGVYVVTTNSGAQAQNVASYTPLSVEPSSIGVFGAYSLTFEAQNNEIISNGINVVSGEDAGVGFPNIDNTDTAFRFPSITNGDNVGDADNSAGMVVRIGTTDGGYEYLSNGGFANESEIITNPTDGFVFGTAPMSGRLGSIQGGVDMLLAGNKFGGNFGSDLYFESFTSTLDPDETTGTWENQDLTDMDQEFILLFQNYTGDPLARLDLTIVDNIIPTADPTNPGAFYDNDEADFKSRVFNNMNTNPAEVDNGPFGSAVRYRHAQRTAIRLYPEATVDLIARTVDITTPDEASDILNPVEPNADGFIFRFPGLGDSTFRVNVSDLDAADLFELEQLGFIFDDNPIAFDGGGNPILDEFSPIEFEFERNGLNYFGEPGNRSEDATEFGWGTFVTPGEVPGTDPTFLNPGGEAPLQQGLSGFPGF